MAQTQLPIFPSHYTLITPVLGFEKRDGMVYYFHGSLPVFTHAEADLASFRMFTSQLVVGGHVSQIEISRSFGVSYSSVKRGVKKYREHGASAFF